MRFVEERADVGALLGVALGHVGAHLRAAEVGAEVVVAARKIGEVEVGVHRMGLPAEEHDRLVAARGARNLRQHPLLGALDDLEAPEPEGVVLDHGQDLSVAVVAGLDAVDLAVERVAMRRDVLEGVDAERGPGGVGGERVLRAFEVGADRLDRAGLLVGRDVALHGGHPVAQEHLHVARGERGVGDGDREHLGLGVVAQRVQHDRRGRRGRGDVGPADVGEHHRVTVGERGSGQPRDRGGGEDGEGMSHRDGLLAGLWPSLADRRRGAMPSRHGSASRTGPKGSPPSGRAARTGPHRRSEGR